MNIQKNTFLLSGAVLKGVVLIGFGMFVIGLIDNFIRPILVRKDTQMPDYVVLISKLGGLALFGLNGFVIGPVIAAMFIAAWELLMPVGGCGRRIGCFLDRLGPSQ